MGRMPVLSEIHSSSEVEERIDELAHSISQDLPKDPIHCVVIEEGARVFAAMLRDRLEARGRHTDRTFIRARRTRGTSLASVHVDPVDAELFRDRSVLLIDDIVDEGRTLEAVQQRIRTGGTARMSIAVLVSKRLRRQVELDVAYVGFELEKGWVVGIGMDLDGRFRELDHLAVVEGSS